MRVLSLSADGECFRFAARRAKDSHPPLHLPARDALLFGPRVYKLATLHTPSILPCRLLQHILGIHQQNTRNTMLSKAPKPGHYAKEPLKESLEKLLWNSYSTLRGHPIIELYSTPIHLQNPYGSPANTLRPGAGACSHPSSPWQTCTRKECPLKVRKHTYSLHCSSFFC